MRYQIEYNQGSHQSVKPDVSPNECIVKPTMALYTVPATQPLAFRLLSPRAAFG